MPWTTRIVFLAVIVGYGPLSRQTPDRSIDEIPAAAESPDKALSLRQTAPCNNCTGTALEFRVFDKSNGRESTVRITNGPHAVSNLQIINPRRGLAIGELLSGRTMAVVLDLDGSSEIDKFHGDQFALSPDKQLLMYTKSYPRMAFGASNEYLVYDLTAAPQLNRVTGEVVTQNTESVGIPVFPPNSLNIPGDNIGVPRTLVHSWGSPGFFWLGNENVVAFGDYNQGALSLVL